MKVLHLVDAEGFYGAAAMALELAQEQKRQGHQAGFICFQTPSSGIGDAQQRFSDAGLEVQGWVMSRWVTPTLVNKLVRFAHELGTDVIHSHGYKGNILLALSPATKRLPVVSTHHGYTATKNDRLLRLYYRLNAWALKRLDKVVCVSNAARSQLAANWSRASTVIIPNGLSRLEDGADFNALEDSATNPLVIGSIGRLAEEKNFPLLIQAFNQLRKEFPSAILQIAGEGPQRSVLENLAAKLDLGDSLQLLGYVENTAAFIQQLTSYVNCSTTEGMPVTLLEVLRQGCPIVASDIAANQELLAEDELGLLFESGNGSALADALRLTANLSPQERTEIRCRQQQAFEQKHTAKTMCDAYMRIYDEVLGSV